jgi:chitodextrinase
MFAVMLGMTSAINAQEPETRVPSSASNLLLTAKITGNLDRYDKGLRGAPDHVVWDLVARRFTQASQWHEYGVGFGADLGIVPEADPAWWMAEWPEPVEANLIILGGVYPNQPQPRTAWKIEVRRMGEWQEQARGVGGWYDRGRYVWGGPGAEPIALDALRVSVFSKDDQTPLTSTHFRGEAGLSWVVASVSPIDASIERSRGPVRATRRVTFTGLPLAGEIASWRWDFGDGTRAEGQTVEHAFAEPGAFEVRLTVSDGEHAAVAREAVEVLPPVEVLIAPLTAPVMAGEVVRFRGEARLGKIAQWTWDFGDGGSAKGQRAEHAFAEPGIYMVRLEASEREHSDTCLAIVRADAPGTLDVPQVVLDTDQKNEQDDQHYFGYALFSELDVPAVNSVHHGGGQEPINYGELVHVLDLARQSGLPDTRVPLLFHGANERLAVPAGGQWEDTAPIITEASEAILAAARGASPTNPVWVVPVGPGTNVASAILQAREQGLDLRNRVRVMWLGGSGSSVTHEFNGNNDPWSMYVVAQSGLETWIMPAPVGARVAIDKRTEGDLYAEHPLGQYLKAIVPAGNKPLFDPSCLSAIISERLGLGWVKATEWVTVAGPDEDYAWTRSEEPTSVRVIREIGQEAMKQDIFRTIKGSPTKLVGVPARTAEGASDNR